jgi:hypothetical protein
MSNPTNAPSGTSLGLFFDDGSEDSNTAFRELVLTMLPKPHANETIQVLAVDGLGENVYAVFFEPTEQQVA